MNQLQLYKVTKSSTVPIILKVTKSSTVPIILYGAGAGALLTVIGLSSNSGNDSGIIQLDFSVPILLVFTAGGAILGGTIGGLIGGKVFKLAAMSPEKRDTALVKIRSYAAIPVSDPQQDLLSRMTLIRR